MNSLVLCMVGILCYFFADLFVGPTSINVCTHIRCTLVLEYQSPSYQKSLICKLILDICLRSSPHQSQSNFLQLRGKLTTWPPCCRGSQQPLSAYDQSVAIAAPWSFPASQSSRGDEWTSGAPIQRGLHVFIRCHGSVIALWIDLAWQGVSFFIFQHVILSWACLCSVLVSRQRQRQKAEKVDVKII